MKHSKFILLYVFLVSFGISLCYCAVPSGQPNGIDRGVKGDSLSSEKTLFRKFADYQKKGRVAISRAMRKLRKSSNVSVYAFVWLFLFSFGYGIFHALGPGHGKAIITFYLLHCKASIRDAVKLVGIIVFTHTALAVIFAFLFYTILRGMKDMAGITMQNYFSFASGIVVAIIGIVLLLKEIKNKDVRNSIAVSDTNIYLMGISAGIVPCPISLAIMLIALSTGMWYVGFTAVLAISLGLALVLFLVAVCIEKSRDGLLKLVASNNRISRFISNGLAYGGLIGVILLGIFLAAFYFPVMLP
ncbi:MAG: hypothetical protein JW871_01705 [Endomicrobiales bacterium]|nr:hypothetical protein [Endomicrobiales bacterium]